MCFQNKDNRTLNQIMLSFIRVNPKASFIYYTRFHGSSESELKDSHKNRGSFLNFDHFGAFVSMPLLLSNGTHDFLRILESLLSADG